MAVLLDGKALAGKIRADLKRRLDDQHSQGKPQPFLTAIQVGEDLPSTVYIRAKQRTCGELGLRFRHIRLPVETTMDGLKRTVREVCADPEVHGVIVQSPLPPHLDEVAVQQMVEPVKDVDCFHPENVGLMYAGRPRFQPGTAAAIVRLLLEYGIDPAGKRVVIIGRSTIVGRPLAIMMMLKARGGNATVTVCHSRTPDLPSITREADIIVPAVGHAELVRGNWVKEGVVAVDVGINRVPDPTKKQGYRLVGDVAFAEVEPKAAAIAPVPGGVGPMTVTVLVSNLMRAAGYDIDS